MKTIVLKVLTADSRHTLEYKFE